MPGMDGFELAELMRGSERTRHVPIIFLTASTPDSTRLFKGYDAGAVDFLFKPIDPHLLLAKVEVFAQLHRQKGQLNSQLEQIQQAQRMSDLFIGVLGHDLRNPLNSIVSAAAMLDQRPGDAEDVRRKARVVLDASKRMERLIQQVLDFALARVKGAIPIEPRATDLERIVRMVVAELGSEAERFQLDVRGDASGHWDSDRLMQLGSNLLSNAVEHGGADAPIRLRIHGNLPDRVTLEVENEGSLPDELCETLFSPFKPRRRNSRGLGLGLYIVEQIASAHGGSVSVRREDRQVCFIVQLPRQPNGSWGDDGRRVAPM
jgi:two-component system sensor histidine kinase/response regulator